MAARDQYCRPTSLSTVRAAILDSLPGPFRDEVEGWPIRSRGALKRVGSTDGQEVVHLCGFRQ